MITTFQKTLLTLILGLVSLGLSVCSYVGVFQVKQCTQQECKLPDLTSYPSLGEDVKQGVCLSQRYGGDAFTGIQNASAITANNVLVSSFEIRQQLNEVIAQTNSATNTTMFGFGSLFLILAILLLFLSCFYFINEKREKTQ